MAPLKLVATRQYFSQNFNLFTKAQILFRQLFTKSQYYFGNYLQKAQYYFGNFILASSIKKKRKKKSKTIGQTIILPKSKCY